MDINFQYAHNDFSESETKANVSPQEALRAFDEFDWSGEVAKANRLQKCSPTLSVIFTSPDELAWVSGAGEESNFGFVTECRFPGEIRKWFGLSKGPGIVHLHSHSFTLDQARRVIELFSSKRYDELRKIYK